MNQNGSLLGHQAPLAVCGAVLALGLHAWSPGRAAADEAKVQHFPAAQVEAAFAKGSVLFDGAGANYMIHASRRESPGKCEVHTKDADVIHVLSGSAVFVTGGQCVDPKTTGTDEIRGESIVGGDVRTIQKGDVIVVPNNTPHWFKEVSGPLLYYVVKVR
jgi:mannose-6-phosphate isomerase-like protein (cupin superfamily)